MKTLFFIGAFIWSLGLNAQRIKIHVTEVMDLFGYDSTITNLINNDSTSQFIREVDGLYDIDLTQKTFKFYVHDKLDWEGEISSRKTGDIIEVNFLIDGFNVGLIINTNISNERVVWFSDDIDYKQICKFSKFEILKSM